jgi:hypothetical protein
MKPKLLVTLWVLLLPTFELCAATHYVSPSSLNPSPPYSTWATAATNIQNAVDAATEGDLVLVTNGAYSGGLVVNEPLTLMGVNGPKFTVIDGGGVNRCVSMTNGVSLSGFTLTNGWAQNGGGVWCNTTNGVVSNCIIAGNSAAQNGGGAYGARFYNCRLTGNSATNGYGGGAESSVLYNCTVTGNTAQHGGGSSSLTANLYGGIAYNSILYFNTAPDGSNYLSLLALVYCDTTPLPSVGVGNIAFDPLFVNVAAGNLRLQSNSPCIDAGLNDFVFGTTDLDGNPRVTGGTVDMGAYEFQYTGAPVITLQPRSTAGAPGTNVTFSAAAGGSPPLFWQWLFNGTAIPGATDSSLTLTAVTTNQAGNYWAVVTNSFGSATSQVAVLDVITQSSLAPNITQQPPSQTVPVGTNVTFSVAATGLFPLSWQWLFNGTAIPNATNSSLTLTAVTTNQSGGYSVVITNAAGSVTSQVAVLTVQESAPWIIQQPFSQPTLEGTNVTFWVVAAGSPPFSYQWLFNGTAITNATNSSLTLTLVRTNQAGGYSVVITNSLGSVTSQVAVLTVVPGNAPSITQQPLSQTVYAGSDAGFVVSASGSAPLFWQWLFDGGAIAGATNSSLTLSVVTTNQAGRYVCVITNFLGSVTSQVAALKVLDTAPVITNQPVSQTVYAGFDVRLTVGAEGSLPLSWQWQFNGQAVQGATNSSLFLQLVSTNQAGIYSVIVSNALGTVTSAGATLTVLPQIISYVWQNSPSPTPPYTNWTTAATTIQDAVDAAPIGALILVTNGTFADGGRTVGSASLTNRVAVDRQMTVRSVNGPEVTIIQGYQIPNITNGTAAIRCVHLADGAALSGFTLTGGATAGFWSTFDWATYGALGGGVFCVSTNAKVTNCLLIGNSAWAGGGAFGGRLDNCTFINNSANLGGGAAAGVVNVVTNSGYLSGGPALGILNNCTLTNNSASEGGGAHGPTLNTCIVSGNSAFQLGGGVSSNTLNNCILIDNSAYEGGGAYNATLNSCALAANSASYGGGAYGGSLNNCALNGNSALYGGGVYSATEVNLAVLLNNCTLTGNSATNLGGGAYGGALNNCIVYYNTAATWPNYYNSTFAYSCTTPLPAGPGNLGVEPLLASPSHLSAQSPCIGRGSAAYVSGVDIDGEPWQNPPCIGADQFISGQTTGMLAVSIAAGYTNVGAGFAVPFHAVIDGALAASVWDFGDGVVVSNHPYASHAWTTPGQYTVSLRAYSDSHRNGVSATVLIQVNMADVYYVNSANATPTPPYNNWASAATDMQSAIDAGTQIGRLVLVADGVYGTGGTSTVTRVTVPEGVHVQSVNGPAVTVINGGGLRCASVGANALLSGFTLTNGFTSGSGGGALCDASAVVANCILSGNSTDNGSGGGAFGGTLTNCILSGNSASQGGAGAYSATLNNCTLSNNSATFYAGGAAESILNNCALIGNSSPQGEGGAAESAVLNNCLVQANSALVGGGVYDATLNNCTVAGNSASYAGGGGLGSTFNNCIVYFNTAPNDPNYASYNTGPFNYSCTTPAPGSGTGNITLDPLFVDYAHGNLRLQSDSPCVGSGNMAYVSGTSDLDGNPRTVGGMVDMGAYEFQYTGGLAITSQPRSTVAYAGTNVTFSVGVAGTFPFSYQWLFNGAALPGATHSGLTLISVRTNQAGDYSVVVTNSFGSVTSQVAVLQIIALPPSITQQPLDQTVSPGSDVGFIVGAQGSPPLFWQWQFNGAPIPAATNSSLSLTQVTSANVGTYSVIVSNFLGSIVSSGAYLALGLHTISHVWQSSPTPTAPYTTWATAAHTIQDALNAAAPGGQIQVTNGLYAGGLVVPKPVSLVGVNGPQFTIIDASGKILSCVSLTNGASLSGFTLTHGESTYPYYGGGVSCSSTNAFLTNCVISGNFAAEAGGGAYQGTLYNCMLTGNTSTNDAGGAYRSTLVNCIASNNVCGGAKACTLYNSAVIDNTLNGGGVVQCTLYNCTLTGNAFGAGASSLYNCLLYYNNYNTLAEGYNYPPPSWMGSGCTLNYCCTTPMPTNGVGNITNEPALLGPWRLSSTSPCRAAGSAAYASGLDLDGQPWLNPPSIGCDEFYLSSAAGPLSVTVTASWTNIATGFAIDLDGAISGIASDCRWEFGDGTLESNLLHTTHQWVTAGDYPVACRAYNKDYPAGATATVTIHVLPTPLFYVNANSASPSAPYTSWATAATTIQQAVDAAALPGSVVLVSNGVYQVGSQLNSRVFVGLPLTIQSVNGPAATFILGSQSPAVRGVYLNTNAVLDGFTLLNGAATDNGGGVYCVSTSAVVTNCILVGNSAPYGGGAYSGTLNNCVLSTNIAGVGGGAAGAVLNACTLLGNSASLNAGGANGGGVYGGTLNNCLLSGNSSGGGGGGAGFATLNNCTLTGNTAESFFAGGAFDCTLNNCIVYDNSAPNHSGSILNYCCTIPMPDSGTGNITNAPLFVSPTGGNFRLQANSPCINAGNNAYVSGTTDLDGNPRIVGGTVDIGAYECQGAGSVISYAWLQQYGLPTDGSADFVDSDGDGMNNWQEWVCGTDPTNALSVLRVLSAASAGTNVAVTWQSVAGINYFLQRSLNISPSSGSTNTAFEGTNVVIIGTNIPGQAGTTTYTDTNASNSGPFYYRVGVPPP